MIWRGGGIKVTLLDVATYMWPPDVVLYIAISKTVTPESNLLLFEHFLASII